MIRGIIQSMVEGVIKRFTASGRSDETITDREYMQHYGFTSSPLPGAEGIIIKEGNHFMMIASDDRRYRIQMANGEVCIYTDEGDNIHFLRGKKIAITSGAEVNVTAPVVNITAATSVSANSPSVILGDSNALALLTSVFATLYNGHTHPDGSGNTGVPNQQAGAGQQTAKVKAT